MARPIVLILHLFRLADMINFRKDYSPPPSSPPSRPYTRGRRVEAELHGGHQQQGDPARTTVGSAVEALGRGCAEGLRSSTGHGARARSRAHMKGLATAAHPRRVLGSAEASRGRQVEAETERVRESRGEDISSVLA